MYKESLLTAGWIIVVYPQLNEIFLFVREVFVQSAVKGIYACINSVTSIKSGYVLLNISLTADWIIEVFLFAVKWIYMQTLIQLPAYNHYRAVSLTDGWISVSYIHN